MNKVIVISLGRIGGLVQFAEAFASKNGYAIASNIHSDELKLTQERLEVEILPQRKVFSLYLLLKLFFEIRKAHDRFIFAYFSPLHVPLLALFLVFRLPFDFVIHNPVGHDTAKKSMPFEDILLRSFVLKANSVWALSNYSAAEVMKLYGRQLEVIEFPTLYPFGREFVRSGLPKNRKTLNFLFIGAAHYYKGFDLLLNAISRSQYQSRINLFVVGKINIADFPIISSLNLSKFSGVFETFQSDQLLDYLEITDYVVLPYRKASQSGILSICEGLGIPALVTDVGGLPEQVSAIPDSFVVPASVEGLVHGLNEIFNGRL